MRLDRLSRIIVCLGLAACLRAQETPGQAAAGEPYGVCVIHGKGPKTRGWTLADLETRLRRSGSAPQELYPVTLEDGGRAFLFKGDGNLQPSHDETLRAKLLKEWWTAYAAQARQVVSLDAYEPAVETYLSGMLSRRLGLAPLSLDYWRPWKSHGTDELLGLLLGTESIRQAMQGRAVLKGGNPSEKADQPLPEAVAPPPVEVPAFDDAKVQVEPMAWRVPKECFYLRASSFGDFQWMRNLLDERGAEFRNLLATRGTDYGLKARLERQLALRETALARTLGGMVIADVALIGTDPFFHEGSAVGLLFHARQANTLVSHLTQLRQEALAKDSTVTETSVTLAGWTVSLLDRPDHAVRSFLVTTGDFVLVTNSRWIAERFLRTASERELSLGSLKEFRYARSATPAANDGLFLYLSDPFFRNLVSPAYRVEMGRRARSGAELTVLSLARLAARAEGSSAKELPALVQEGFLPAGFGTRADGSSLRGDLDSLRGGRGSFLPVPDVAVEAITPTEAEEYESFARAYERIWTNVDPVFGSLSRKPAAGGRERLALELHISPYAKQSYGFLQTLLGPAGDWRLAQIPGNLLSVEAVLRTSLPMLGGEDEARSPKDAQRVFAGLRDFSVPFHLEGGTVQTDSWKQSVEVNLRGYLGFYKAGRGGLAELVTRKQREASDAQGYSRQDHPWSEGEATGKAGLWTRIFSDFAVTGIDRTTLETVTPRLKLQKAPRTAQLRLELGNLASSHLAPFLTAHLYARARRTSAGNALFLDTLASQLKVPAGEVLAAAETVLDQRLACPLGGSYAADPAAPGLWRSSAWKEATLDQVNRVPEGFRPPALDWLKAMGITLGMDQTALWTSLELEVAPR